MKSSNFVTLSESDFSRFGLFLFVHRTETKSALICSFYDGLTSSCKTVYGVNAAQMPFYAMAVVCTIYFIFLEISIIIPVHGRVIRWENAFL